MGFYPLVRDQEVDGSNPFAPTILARNCCLLGRDRYWGDSVSELFGFGLEALDL